MLTPEEYLAFERQQQQKFSQTASAESFASYERWQITRYNNNLNRYFVTARHELGTQFSQYITKGNWKGGKQIENQMFEELQYKYRNTEGVRVVRNIVAENCKFFEILEYGMPKSCYMIVDGKQFLYSKPHKLKDGYRYRLK